MKLGLLCSQVMNKQKQRERLKCARLHTNWAGNKRRLVLNPNLIQIVLNMYRGVQDRRLVGKCCQILIQHTLSSRKFQIGNSFIFQDDNDPINTASVGKACWDRKAHNRTLSVRSLENSTCILKETSSVTRTKGGQTKYWLKCCLTYYIPIFLKKSINPFSSAHQIQGLEPILEDYFRGGYTLERLLVCCKAKKMHQNCLISVIKILLQKLGASYFLYI